MSVCALVRILPHKLTIPLFTLSLLYTSPPAPPTSVAFLCFSSLPHVHRRLCKFAIVPSGQPLFAGLLGCWLAVLTCYDK